MKQLIVLAMCLIGWSALAQIGPTNPPAQVTLAWDASTDPKVNGYRVYFGVAPRFYTNFVQVTTTMVTIPNLKRGTTYYFAATSLNTENLESDFSNEVSYTAPLPPTPPVLRLSIDGSGKTITGRGEPNTQYEIQRAVGITNSWETLRVIESDMDGSLLYYDTDPSYTKAFYRAKGA